MKVEFDRIAAFFADWTTKYKPSGASAEVARWLAGGASPPEGFIEIVHRYGGRSEQWLRDAMLDLVLAYAEARLAVQTLTAVDISDVRLLKMALHVRDGEFFERRPKEVSAFLQAVLENILADGVIEDREDLYLVEVQNAFDLSYDQLLTLSRPALEQAIQKLRSEVPQTKEGSAGRLEALNKLAALEPTYLLAKLHRRAPRNAY